MYWTNLLIQVSSEFIPHREVTVHPKEKPWINTELKRMIRRRNLLWSRFSRSGSADHYATFKLFRNRVVSLNRQLRNSLGEELSSPSMPNRKWWNTVRQVTGDKVYFGIPTLIENGKPVMTTHFHPFRYETDERLEHMTFCPSDIHNIKKKLRCT